MQLVLISLFMFNPLSEKYNIKSKYKGFQSHIKIYMIYISYFHIRFHIYWKLISKTQETTMLEDYNFKDYLS